MLSLLLFATLAIAQTPQPASSNPACFPLTGTTMCGPYAAMQVLPLQDVFTDVTSFDAFINTVKDSNASYIADFKTRYACPGFQGLGQRFHMSTYCGLFVNAATSNGCNNKAEDVQICPASIASAIQSLNVIYASSVCTPTTTNPGRINFLQGYSNYQGRLSNTSSTCLSGFQYEIAQCGFFTLPEAQTYCATNGQDPCCGPTQLSNSTLPLMIKNTQNGKY